MELQNLITKCIDTENILISYMHFDTLRCYACLSKTNNKLIKKNKSYKKLFYFYKNRPIVCVGKPWEKKPISLMDWCCKQGHIDVLELLKKSNHKFIYCNNQKSKTYSDAGVIEASKNGHTNILDWMLKNDLYIGITELSVRWASGNGHVNILEWWKNYAHQHKIYLVYDVWCINWASAGGHVNVLHWWKNSGLGFKYTDWAIDTASRNGHIKVLEWWKQSGLEFKYTLDALDDASNWKKIKVLDWWAKSGYQLKYTKSKISSYHTDVQNWWNNYLNSKSSSSKSPGDLESRHRGSSVDKSTLDHKS